jgi:hypothetical protein
MTPHNYSTGKNEKLSHFDARKSNMFAFRIESAAARSARSKMATKWRWHCEDHRIKCKEDQTSS